MKIAKYLFLLAGISGVILLLPLYFDKSGTGEAAVTRPEFYYGFIGIALAFQVLFIIISFDLTKYRPAIIPCIIEKLSFAVPVIILYFQNRVSNTIFYAGIMDLILGILFAVVFFQIPKRRLYRSF